MRPEQELAERNNQEARVEALAKRLDELSQAVSHHNMGEFTMRVPAEPERDADIVLLDASTELVAQRTRIEELESKLDAAEKDRDKAQQACAVAYQILGSLSSDFDCFEHPAIQDALTMLADHEETKELLPWNSRHPEQWRLEASKAADEYREQHQCDRNAMCIIDRGHEGDCEVHL